MLILSVEIYSIYMTKEEIIEHIGGVHIVREVHYFDVLDSTNNYAKKLLRESPVDGTLVVAEEQTGGRGRMGREWKSEKGKNLTFSLSMKTAVPTDRLGIISITAGLAVAEAITTLTELAPLCKWPNDIILNGRKVCGILSESLLTSDNPPAVVIGIGINVNQTDFPPELHRTATSLAIEAGKAFERLNVLRAILSSFGKWFTFLEVGESEAILAKWEEHSFLRGKEITIDHNGKLVKGIAGTIDPDGSLYIHTDGQDMKVFAGDITAKS